MKKEQFIKMIRKVVSEEVRKQLPDVLSEMYIKNIVAEQVVPNKRVVKEQSFDNIFNDKFEEKHGSYIDDGGNYNIRYSESKKIKPKVESPLLNKSNPMSFLYEDVNPVEDTVDKVDIDGVNFDRMSNLVEAMEQKNSGPIPHSFESKMRDIERHRQSLEKKVG